MKIVVAFDSYKGSLSADVACQAASDELRQLLPQAEIIALPLSDGGEGLVNCVSQRLDVRQISVSVHDPLMRPITAHYALSVDGQTAYIEMAAASGLTLVAPAERDVMRVTTYGVGEMLIDAAQRGVRRVVMGIGGSATCDGGRGMLQCLEQHGYRFPSCSLPAVTVACDVNNPLYGTQGAAYVFAPQKGATTDQVMLLDKQLRQWARDTELRLGVPESLANHPGAGAAGGLGYGLMAYLGAELQSGIDVILNLCQFDSIVADADVVITGEGKSDRQTLMGKVPHGVLRHCRECSQCQVWLVSGAIEDPDGQLASRFDVTASINAGDSRPLDVLMLQEIAEANLRKRIREMKE